MLSLHNAFVFDQLHLLLTHVKLLRDLAALPVSLRGGAVAIGNFDGVHLGHARIVERLVAKAAEVAGPSVIFTFDPHPVRLLRPDHAPPPLTWTDRKAELLGALGVDLVIAFPTTEEFLRLPADDFFRRIVGEGLDAKAIVEGPNFFFGRGRGGNVELLEKLGIASNRLLEIVPPVQLSGEYISSSRVRHLIAAGDVQAANQMLTAPYRIRGMVTHGAGRGATIGFPTANVSAIDTLLPGAGVYAGRAKVDRDLWPAAINIGPNPTFGEHAMKVEVHLLDFVGSLYGMPLEVDFLAKLRDIRRFESSDALVLQLQQDVLRTRHLAQTVSAE